MFNMYSKLIQIFIENETYLFYFRILMKPETKMKLLSRSEEIVLLCVWKLQEDAYGVTIRKLVSEATGHEWSIGAIYAPLHRLEKKGYVRTKQGEPVAERGGRSKVFYKLSEKGKKSLLEIKKVHETVWVGIPSLEINGNR